MSSIARAVLILEKRLDHVVAAAMPRRRLFRGTVDEFETVFAAEARRKLEFGLSGFLLATLLSFLEERGVDLMTSEHSAHAEALSAARQCTCVILTDAQRIALSSKLAQLPADEAVLGKYYAEFNDTEESDAGAAMLEGLAYLRAVLDAVSKETVAIVMIG